jgi:F420-dependent oxidoreductase-like protein
MVTLVQEAERLGFDSAWVPEAWGTDAVSILGGLAARTERVKLGTSIVNVFSRTPALLAQTAATLDLISQGRFILGLGTSGWQVVSGWHGLPFQQPLARLRETIEIVRLVLKREPLKYSGKVLKAEQGLHLLAHPLRAEIPIYLATLTPGGLRLTGELADGWIPYLFSPYHPDVLLDPLRDGARAAGRELTAIEIAPAVSVSIHEDIGKARDALRSWLALYIGGMGSKDKNFYNSTVASYGFSKEAQYIQSLYLSGRRVEATRSIPDRLIDEVTIAARPRDLPERLEGYRSCGVSCLIATPFADSLNGAMETIELLAGAAG